MSEQQQSPGTSNDTLLHFLRGYTVDAAYSALTTKRKEYYGSTAMSKMLDSDSAQVATLLTATLSTTGVAGERYVQMLLRPAVVKRHVQQSDGKLRRFLDAGPPPVQTSGTGFLKVRRQPMAAAAPAPLGAGSNVLYFTGCAGTGKSHILRELAARALGTSANVRVVAIEDCWAWAALDDGWAQVSFLARAIGLGFAADNGFGAATFHALRVAEMTSPGMLALQILDSVDRFCKARVDAEGRPVRVLFCMDGFSDNKQGLVSDVVRSIAQRSDVFFLALATTANEFVPSFVNAATRVPPRYSDAEGQVMLDYYVATAFDNAVSEHMSAIAEKPLVHRVVEQNTAFHPGDMALLFRRVAGARDFDDFSRRASGFTTDYADLDNTNNEVWSGPGSGGSLLRQTCLQPRLSETVEQVAEAMFRLFFNLSVDRGLLIAATLGGSRGVLDAEYNAFFQLFLAGERGPGSPSELEFVSPRRANFVFDCLSRDISSTSSTSVFRMLSGRLGLGKQARYEMAYACVLWMLRREGLGFLSATGATCDQRLFGAAPDTRQGILANVSQRFAPGISTIGFHTTAGERYCMRGLDFVTYRRCDSNSLASFVLATACDSDEIVSVMENCAYQMPTPDDAQGSSPLPPLPVAMMSAEEMAFAGVLEASKVSRHLRKPQSTVYLVVSEGVFRNTAPKKVALPGPMGPRLELVSIKSVLRNSVFLPVNDLRQLC
ncbi:hypothetical protein IWW38_000603 [Coemansia aciculifera]|uniref:Uncharacterized protein n=1 Tax=Coemansia aciculifera TaxID=417176 RepID=A0ACC1MA95_9FUNG|nr:hypothetical protein IWW38_000603 [Coemansia aciculifera]